MNKFLLGAVLSSLVVFPSTIHLISTEIAENAGYEVCEQELVLRKDVCRPYYLTTDEVKLIERLEEIANGL